MDPLDAAQIAQVKRFATASFIRRLAEPKPKVEIGARWTGKREYHWDSRTGVYSESMPLMHYDDWLVQRALCPPAVLRQREPSDIRQHG